ncbi:hypothetical protein OA857_04045 [Alphaproteobacteria bacterium]|nr:hypothetical protein [Alphaproteobacteria bacterium]
MVKKLAVFLFILFIGCEMNSEQLIKNENITYENIIFNTVSKDLIFIHNQEGPEVEIAKQLINKWFSNNIKIDGFDGNLSVRVTSIDINKIKKNEYYRFEINLNIEFLETNETLNKRKIYKINSLEFGEINGSFSISDMENLNTNTIYKSLNKINQNIIDM